MTNLLWIFWTIGAAALTACCWYLMITNPPPHTPGVLPVVVVRTLACLVLIPVNFVLWPLILPWVLQDARKKEQAKKPIWVEWPLSPGAKPDRRGH